MCEGVKLSRPQHIISEAFEMLPFLSLRFRFLPFFLSTSVFFFRQRHFCGRVDSRPLHTPSIPLFLRISALRPLFFPGVAFRLWLVVKSPSFMSLSTKFLTLSPPTLLFGLARGSALSYGLAVCTKYRLTFSSLSITCFCTKCVCPYLFTLSLLFHAL